LKRAGSPFEVFGAFLLLGISSFGGPVAHLGYFRRSFVDRRNWLSEAEYASLVALCQLLPGPASSQAGFGIGCARAGLLGGLAAWVGFTLPSALLMFFAAIWVRIFAASPVAELCLHGMQLAAVAVISQAVYVMARGLCPDTPRRMLAVLAAAILILVPDTGGQVAVLLIGAFIGRFLPMEDPASRPPRTASGISDAAALACLAIFGILVAVALTDWNTSGGFALFETFFRTGALVFGGGHVVLPLLQNAVVAPGYVSPGLFLAGYGAAQAMPGPLFTLAAFLGAVATNGPGGPAGAAIALVGIFLPGLLLVAGLLPFWSAIRQNRALAGCINGVNAVVVGLLAFALLNLITIGSVHSLADALIILAALAALIPGRMPPVLVVGGCVAAVLVI